MKKVSMVLVLVVVLLFAATAAKAQQNVKIGFVDIQKVINESEPGKRAKDALESYIKTHQTKIEEKEKAIDSMKADLDKKGSALSEEAKKKKQDEMQTMVRDIKRMAAEAQDEVRKKETDLTKDVFTDIRTIIRQIGKDDGYTAILESGAVLYSTDNVDITDKIVKKLNDLKKK
ncbi:MAG: OmpH family outer membrane protein [Nitrospirota bacterium]|uniref:OmpH-like outer membrane protein n=1 Tax=Candidatus Magnetominusculus xianensis TaxID=1748249 RepID=A0ABR5SGE9_9BACT|nr:OmpH family outer membrane protein [Candidatus Magnetominusculus xianensis]KWT89586.1 OmpH-like outer membrane protein [Candidatus Magnetominusculus xianensis]MBF0405557.1 OmpH family outer membrane protein [Nitrospirota bacterium]